MALHKLVFPHFTFPPCKFSFLKHLISRALYVVFICNTAIHINNNLTPPIHCLLTSLKHDVIAVDMSALNSSVNISQTTKPLFNIIIPTLLNPPSICNNNVLCTDHVKGPTAHISVLATRTFWTLTFTKTDTNTMPSHALKYPFRA